MRKPGEWEWIEADLGAREVPAKVVNRALELWGGAIDTFNFGSIKNVPYELADRKARAALGRIGQPEEIGAAVAVLASADASYVTGATLVLEGGWIASHRCRSQGHSPTRALLSLRRNGVVTQRSVYHI